LWRSSDFGVMTISGLRCLRSIWRRSRWKICAGVVGTQTCHVVLGAQLHVALDAGRRVLRALTFVAVRQQHDQTARRPHLASPEAMNWSITTWAPLAKSPNWASQITSSFGFGRRVAVFEGQHGFFGQHGVDQTGTAPAFVLQVLQRHVGALHPSFSRFWSCSTAWRWKKVPRPHVFTGNAHTVALHQQVA
jgi:hypothetical protein